MKHRVFCVLEVSLLCAAHCIHIPPRTTLRTTYWRGHIDGQSHGAYVQRHGELKRTLPPSLKTVRWRRGVYHLQAKAKCPLWFSFKGQYGTLLVSHRVLENSNMYHSTNFCNNVSLKSFCCRSMQMVGTKVQEIIQRRYRVTSCSVKFCMIILFWLAKFKDAWRQHHKT